MHQTHQLIQLMNIISNLIFHCNNCDANRAFVTTRENTAAAPSSSLLNAKFTFKGTSPPIIFARIVKASECPTTLSLTFFPQKNFVADFREKMAVLRFGAPGGLRDNVRCSSWAHWKARSGLPISVN